MEAYRRSISPDNRSALAGRNPSTMKHVFRNTIAGATAALILPCASWAQDRPAPETPPSPPAEGTQNATPGSLESGGTFANQNQPGPASGGVMVHEGKAYIIHRLQTEMSLPDGSKIQPNGTIEGKDGSLRQVGEHQMLTLDGRMLTSPFTGPSQPSGAPGATQTESSPTSVPGTSSPGTDGSTTAPGASTTPATTSGAAQPSDAADAKAPASSTPFSPDSSPVAPPPQPNPLESTSPGSGLQDTSPQTLQPDSKPATDGSTTQPFRESTTVPKQPESISTDPTRDRVE